MLHSIENLLKKSTLFLKTPRMYTLGAGGILIKKSIIIVCYWHGRLAGLTEKVK